MDGRFPMVFPATADLNYARGFLLQFLSLIMGNQSIEERLYLSIHDRIKLVNRESDAVIAQAVLREVVGPDLLAAVSGLDHGAALFGQGFLLLFHLDLVEAGAQHAHAFFTVLDLRFLVLATHHRVGRNVGDTHGGISCIHRLSSRTGGAESVDPQVFRLDLDVHIFGFRQHGYGYSRGVDTPLLFGLRHSLYAVHAALIFQLRVHPITLNDRNYLFQAAHRRFGSRQHLHFPA